MDQQVSTNDEVTPPCRCVTLLRHAIEYGTGMLTEEENMDYKRNPNGPDADPKVIDNRIQKWSNKDCDSKR